MSNSQHVKTLILVLSLSIFPCRGDDMKQSLEYNLGMRDADAADARNEVCLFAEAPLSKIEPRGVLYGSGGRKAILLYVYGVVSEKAQTKLVELIELEQERKGWRPIHIVFKRREVWIEKPNGVRERGNEEVLAVRTLRRSR
jgi:hypothetical protein